MASRRTGLSASPSRLERTPSTDLDLAPLTDHPRDSDRPKDNERSRGNERPKNNERAKKDIKIAVRPDKRERLQRTLTSTTPSRTAVLHQQQASANNAPDPAEEANKIQKTDKNTSRNIRRRRARILSELEAADERNNAGLLSVPSHTLAELLTPLGSGLPTLPFSLLPMESASRYYHLIPLIVNHKHGSSMAIWLPDCPVNIVPSYMVRVDHQLDDSQLEHWALDDETSIRVGPDQEIHFRFGHSSGLTLCKESPELQVPIVGHPGSAMLGIIVCPIRGRLSNAMGDSITAVRCLRR